MTSPELLLLEILSAALQGIPYSSAEAPDADVVRSAAALADEQKILPLIFDAAALSVFFTALSREEYKELKSRALKEVTRQVTQTGEFLVLLKKLQDRGYDPIVVKGMACSRFYPQSCLRLSVDEDIFVPDKTFFQYRELLADYGMDLDFPENYSKDRDEISFHKRNSPLYIEVHRHLFPSVSELFSDFNSCFASAQEKTIQFKVQDLQVRTLDPTDHYLYLLLHAFKHFLYSGFGIRLVCDIALFGRCCKNEICWSDIKKQLELWQAFGFGRAVWRIIDRYIYPGAFQNTAAESWLSGVSEIPLLEDILHSGLHGDSSMERLHSAGITLQAVEHDRQGKKQGRSLLPLIFPPVKNLASRYPYLKKKPFLLPFAWGQRVFHYAAELKGQQGTDAVGESLALGRKRIRLLEQYGIIDR